MNHINPSAYRKRLRCSAKNGLKRTDAAKGNVRSNYAPQLIVTNTNRACADRAPGRSVTTNSLNSMWHGFSFHLVSPLPHSLTYRARGLRFPLLMRPLSLLNFYVAIATLRTGSLALAITDSRWQSNPSRRERTWQVLEFAHEWNCLRQLLARLHRPNQKPIVIVHAVRFDRARRMDFTRTFSARLVHVFVFSPHFVFLLLWFEEPETQRTHAKGHIN